MRAALRQLQDRAPETGSLLRKLPSRHRPPNGKGTTALRPVRPDGVEDPDNVAGWTWAQVSLCGNTGHRAQKWLTWFCPGHGGSGRGFLAELDGIIRREAQRLEDETGRRGDALPPENPELAAAEVPQRRTPGNDTIRMTDAPTRMLVQFFGAQGMQWTQDNFERLTALQQPERLAEMSQDPWNLSATQAQELAEVTRQFLEETVMPRLNALAEREPPPRPSSAP